MHANRGSRNAGRGRGQAAGAPLPEPEVDLDAGIEVDNLRRQNENNEWEEEEPERRRQVQEHQLPIRRTGTRRTGVNGLFDVCPICRAREAKFFISCCLRHLCEPCIRNLSIPRVVEHVAIPMNICPFCRQAE